VDNEPDIEGPPRSPAGGAGRRRPAVATAPLRLVDLDRSQRRQAVLRAALTIVVAWVIILGAFYVLPFSHLSHADSALRLAAVVALVAAVLTWQIRRISTAELPELRAIEALGIVIAVFLVGFSIIYLSMSHNAAATFTQPLDHTRSLYFTVSIFSTVGFGDITPRTDTARLVVSAQMLLDLVLIGAVVRLIFNAARTRVASSGGQTDAAAGVPPT
jgi:voltage-gated potassium channel